jgi:ATP-dependent exoDNAse (exonuclease V) beta subunit
MGNLVVYNASAGSGKTFTLALEYLCLCLKSDNPNYFRHILAITFTNKAAHELKERIIRFAETLGNPETEDADSYEALLEQARQRTGLEAQSINARAAKIHRCMLYRYADLNISTIDSFILSVLRSFSKELGLPFDFDVELDHDKINDLLIQEVLSKIGSDEFITEQLIEWAGMMLGEGKTWNPKRSMREALNELMNEESLHYRARLIQGGREQLKQGISSILDEINAEKKAIRDIQAQVRELLSGHGLDPAWFNRGTGGFISFAYQDVPYAKLPTQGHLDIVADKGLLSGEGKKYTSPDAVESIRGTLLEAITQVRALGTAVLQKDLLVKNRISLVLALELEELIRQMEKEEGMSILADNNAKVARLIGSNPAPFIYERVGERYRHYLIDEFQDTSVLQWRNMLPLLEESLSMARTNYLVGDAKQSIYRWRGGEVDQLVDLPKIPSKRPSRRLHELERTLEAHYDGPSSLQTNYRSAKAVIDFNNALFPVLQNELTEKYQQAYADVQQEQFKQKEGYVLVQRLEDKVKLEEILETVWEQILTCEADGYRGADICLLTRSNADARTLASFLEQRDKSVASPDALLLRNHAQVQMLISLVQILSGNESKGAMLYLITQLLEMRERSTESVLYQLKLRKMSNTEVLLVLMNDLAIEWPHAQLQEMSPYSAIDRMIAVLDLDSSDPYLLELLNLAAGFGARQESTFKGFLDFWWDKNSSLSVKAGVNPESIQVMTIHKSKGLQFPVVIIPLMNWKSTGYGREKAWVELEESSLDIALLDVSSKLDGTPFADIIAQERAKSDLDKLNLLYVACTRPEERLYINLSDRGQKGLGRSLCAYVDEHGTNGMIELGSASARTIKDTKISGAHELRTYEKNQKEELLDVVLSSADHHRRERVFGDMVHALLEKGLEGEPLSRSITNSGLEPIEQEALLEAVKEAKALESEITLPEHSTIHREISLLDEHGKSYRIDKLYFNEDTKQAVIVDYKTGKQKDDDLQQMNSYMNLLTRMGYAEVKAYLIYTETKEVVAA